MYSIKTYTKSEHEITDEQEFKLRSMSGGDKIYLKDGSMLMVNNIAEIIKIKDDAPKYKELEAPRLVYSKAQLINALIQMIKGFKNHFDDRKLSPKSQTLLNHMENKLEEARQTKEEKKFRNPIWDFTHDF